MSKDLLFKLFSIVEGKADIDEEIIRYINEIFSNRSERVLEVVKKGISKYIYKPSNRTIWVAMGEKCEHLIYPKIYCSCQDFYKNVVISRKRDFCKHILAQVICETLNDFQVLELEDSEFSNLINDIELEL